MTLTHSHGTTNFHVCEPTWLTMAMWTGNNCHSLWGRKLSYGGAESSPRSHDQHMATDAKLKTKASCLTWALLLDRWEMSHLELPSEALSISHAGGLPWGYPLTWFSALPLSKAGKETTWCISLHHGTVFLSWSLHWSRPCPAYAVHFSVWWLAMSIWVYEYLLYIQICACMYTPDLNLPFTLLSTVRQACFLSFTYVECASMFIHMCGSACVGARGWWQVYSSIALYFIYYSRVSCWTQHLLIQLDGQLTQRIFCDCLLKHRGYRRVLIPIRVFVWMLRLLSEDLTLRQQVLYPQSHSHCP